MRNFLPPGDPSARARGKGTGTTTAEHCFALCPFSKSSPFSVGFLAASQHSFLKSIYRLQNVFSHLKEPPPARAVKDISPIYNTLLLLTQFPLLLGHLVTLWGPSAPLVFTALHNSVPTPSCQLVIFLLIQTQTKAQHTFLKDQQTILPVKADHLFLLVIPLIFNGLVIHERILHHLHTSFTHRKLYWKMKIAEVSVGNLKIFFGCLSDDKCLLTLVFAYKPLHWRIQWGNHCFNSIFHWKTYMSTYILLKSIWR